MKFCFGDIVVVEKNLIGVVVRDWIKSTYDNKLVPHHEVYVRYFNEIRDYSEESMERYMVRHKYLDGNEIIYQSNAVNNRMDYVPEEAVVNREEINSPTLPEIFYDDVNRDIEIKYSSGTRQRAINSLYRASITNLDGFFSKSPIEINRIRNLGYITKGFILDAIYNYCEKYKIKPKYSKSAYSC